MTIFRAEGKKGPEMDMHDHVRGREAGGPASSSSRSRRTTAATFFRPSSSAAVMRRYDSEGLAGLSEGGISNAHCGVVHTAAFRCGEDQFPELKVALAGGAEGGAGRARPGRIRRRRGGSGFEFPAGERARG